MKKFIGLTLVVAMVSVVGLPLFAENGSPWDTTVPVSVGIAEMTELWMDNNAVALSITDAAGVNDDSRAVRSVTYLSNCPIDVSVQIAGDIIDGTYFYIVEFKNAQTTLRKRGKCSILK